MFPSKLTCWFLNFMVHNYFLHLCYYPDVAHATLKYDGCEWTKLKANFESGVNCPCSKNIRITQLVPNLFDVGEEPFYDKNSVYFVDEDAGTVNRYCIKTGQFYYAKVGNETVSVIIPIKGRPTEFLITFGDYLAILAWDGRSQAVSFRKIGKPDPRHPWPKFFINDAKIARNGALFFYTEPVVDTDITTIPRRESTLFSIFRGVQKTLITNLDFGNGLGYSCDGSWFYHSDSVRNLTYKSFYNQETNSLEYTSVLLNYADLRVPGNPDSLTVDADGFVWIACNGGSRIVKVDPRSGQVVCSVHLPAKTVTNLAFGRCPRSCSDKLDCIYVTSLSDGAKKFDGGFFLIEGVGSRGVEPDQLRFDVVFGHHRRYK